MHRSSNRRHRTPNACHRAPTVGNRSLNRLHRRRPAVHRGPISGHRALHWEHRASTRGHRPTISVHRIPNGVHRSQNGLKRMHRFFINGVNRIGGTTNIDPVWRDRASTCNRETTLSALVDCGRVASPAGSRYVAPSIHSYAYAVRRATISSRARSSASGLAVMPVTWLLHAGMV